MQDDDESSWLDHMTGYLSWRVTGPDIHNPYKALPSTATLKRMTSDAPFLMQHICIRCSCDGHEVMVIVNPDAPRIQSNHPSVASLSNRDVIGYLHRNNLDQTIADEIEKIRLEILKVVQAQEAQKAAKPSQAQTEKKEKQKPATAAKPEAGMRIIRR